jgi:hypothetical protein
MRYDDDYEGYSYSSVYNTYGRGCSMSINICLDIEREIKLYEKTNKSVEQYIKSIYDNDQLENIVAALSEVVNTKFPQYSIYLH